MDENTLKMMEHRLTQAMQENPSFCRHCGINFQVILTLVKEAQKHRIPKHSQQDFNTPEIKPKERCPNCKGTRSSGHSRHCPRFLAHDEQHRAQPKKNTKHKR
jgi:hypothetical protein